MRPPIELAEPHRGPPSARLLFLPHPKTSSSHPTPTTDSAHFSTLTSQICAAKSLGRILALQIARTGLACNSYGQNNSQGSVMEDGRSETGKEEEEMSDIKIGGLGRQ